MADCAHRAGHSVGPDIPVLRPALVSLYAWLLAVSTGAVLLDIVYAAQLDGARTVGSALVFSEVADLLLSLAAVTLLAGIGALAAAWPHRTTRRAVAVSVVVFGALTIAAPLLAPAIDGLREASGLHLGPWLRLGAIGLACVAAFIGLRQVLRPD